jgi:hypothetical protein
MKPHCEELFVRCEYVGYGNFPGTAYDVRCVTRVVTGRASPLVADALQNAGGHFHSYRLKLIA